MPWKNTRISRTLRPSITPYALIYEALDNRLLLELHDAWDLAGASIGVWTRGDWCRTCDQPRQYTQADVDQTVERWISQLDDWHSLVDFCSRYLSRAKYRGLPEAAKINPVALAQYILDDQNLRDRGVYGRTGVQGDWVINDRILRELWASGLLAYVPYLHWSEGALAKIECAHVLRRAVEHFVMEKGNVVWAERIHVPIEDCWISGNLFLEIVRNHRDLLILYQDIEANKAIGALHASAFLPGFSMAPYAAQLKRAISWRYRDNQSAHVDVSIETRRLCRVVGLESLSVEGGWIDPFELAEKLERKRRSAIDSVQGLPPEIHEIVVNVLRKRRQAVSQRELDRVVGMALEMAPENLPPGRILAYAPTRRYLSRANAYYVLREWVETETRKKGKIAKTRVATPLEEKDISFEEKHVQIALGAQRTWIVFGLLNLEEAVRSIARQLPSAPIDVYHLKRIRLELLARYSGEFRQLGKGYVIREDAAPVKKVGEPLRKYRIRVIEDLIRESEEMVGTNGEGDRVVTIHNEDIDELRKIVTSM